MGKKVAAALPSGGSKGGTEDGIGAQGAPPDSDHQEGGASTIGNNGDNDNNDNGNNTRRHSPGTGRRGGKGNKVLPSEGGADGEGVGDTLLVAGETSSTAGP